MNLLHWLMFWREREFPEPKEHTLTLEEFLAFWSQKLSEAHRSECAVMVYRMDPARAPFPSLTKLFPITDLDPALERAVKNMMPDDAWWTAQEAPRWPVVFCARLQRTWNTRYGSRSEEICVCTFEVES